MSQTMSATSLGALGNLPGDLLHKIFEKTVDEMEVDLSWEEDWIDVQFDSSKGVFRVHTDEEWLPNQALTVNSTWQRILLPMILTRHTWMFTIHCSSYTLERFVKQTSLALPNSGLLIRKLHLQFEMWYNWQDVNDVVVTIKSIARRHLLPNLKKLIFEFVPLNLRNMGTSSDRPFLSADEASSSSEEYNQVIEALKGLHVSEVEIIGIADSTKLEQTLMEPREIFEGLSDVGFLQEGWMEDVDTEEDAEIEEETGDEPLWQVFLLALTVPAS